MEFFARYQRQLGYTGLGTDSASYICYAEMRIATKELEEFLKAEPW